ncbi:homoserine/homoserine lactone efflux protein [Vibrio sp. UCD-FRSSP16_10]|uniref:homoserine/homoserine lactone efflux protein n=1 Tax=unclassified Vibrio TaxID=2614977 RepID=UPI0007FD1B07|nr:MULTISPECIES: homoserine/homoserine lactone efflux protein [unclassified Vibrio]OBT10199.1 homoserine/homoserine lactone efflux protein [Vibrio sp. UCD-FRSSP16_30]OBT18989.1 homoserine/homoserine lactone efflux protein [Vibrio sp. UCD-FRSSP16_10]
MELKVWLAYVATAVIFSLAPGSGTVNSIANGINFGMRKSLSAIAGLQLGLAFHIVLVGAGIGALVAQSALAFTLIKWVGVAYLIWLGIQKWRDNKGFKLVESHQQISAGTLLKQAVFINLTNPKSIVFLVALFPQFIDPSLPHLPQLLILGVTTIAIDGMVMLGYTGLAAQMGRFIRSDKIIGKLNKIFGSMFIGCGLLLAAAKG